MVMSAVSTSKQKKIDGNKSHLSLQHVEAPSLFYTSKRNKSPGIRIIGGRIYDSEDGNTCHQCRQKTMDFFAACKGANSRKKPCTKKFCRKCLLNRYGENAEEKAILDDWKCPKCRGICNCSFCMKKKGHQPTGILVPTAKATGFSSVSQMLDIKGPEAVEKVVRDLQSLNKQPVSSKALIVYSRRKRGKENDLANQGDMGVKCNPLLGNGDVKIESKSAETKKLRLDEINGDENERNQDDGDILIKDLKIKTKKKVPFSNVKKGEKVDGSEVALPDGKEIMMPNGNNADNAEMKDSMLASKIKLEKHIAGSCYENESPQDTLPQGEELTVVAGIEFPADDVGPALQFLEFCTTFGEALELTSGQPESVLRELMHGRVGRRGPYSSFIQFHIKLLSIMQISMGEVNTPLDSTSNGNSWLSVLVKCISESQYTPKELLLDRVKSGTDGYENLDSSEKLRVLNFLCDEALSTAHLRRWIFKENSKNAKGKKEEKEKLQAAKQKVNHMKKRLRDEVARSYLSPGDDVDRRLSVSEHEDLISKIRNETQKAEAEKLEAMKLALKRKQRSEAIRTEPVLFDGKGHAYWRLRGCSSGSCLLLQDIGSWDLLSPQDKWFIFDDEQEKMVKKYISSFKKLQHEAHQVPHTIALGIDEASVKHDSLSDSTSQKERAT